MRLLHGIGQAVPSGRGAGHTVPRRATRQQRQQRSAEAEEVESAKPHMQPTKGGRARRASWPLGSSSGGRRPLCVFRVRNPDLSEAERVQFLRSDRAKELCLQRRTSHTCGVAPCGA